MNSSPLDKISAAHQEELAKLKSGKRSWTVLLFVLCGLLLLLSITISSVPSALKGREGLERARQEMLGRASQQAAGLSESQREYGQWLQVHGLEIERRIYNQLSQLLFVSAANVAQPGSGTFFSNLLVALHSSLLRVAFILIACWRLWIVGIVLAALYAYRGWKAYDGDDILGQMSTGQLFYSGLKADLSRVSATGAPEKQVTGLACPQFSSETEGALSPAGQVIKRWGVDNHTNRMLARILTAYKDWPAYVAEFDNEAVFTRYFAGASLTEHAGQVLERLLSLHKEYQEQPEGVTLEPHFEGSEVAEEKVSSAEYAWLLQHSCHRVLTPAMRQTMAEVPPALVATLVLSHFAGKIMAYGFQGGKWIRRSNFPELCARAVLHSIAEFGSEYVFEERATIRRALIYGSRRNIFAPVRFPVDLGDDTRALRQWVELLLALPHELQSTGDEVELIGTLHEMHGAWSAAFFDGAVGLQRELVEGTYATQSNLFVAPVENLIRLAQRTIPPELLRRTEELASLVSQKQRLETMNDQSLEAQIEKGGLYNQGKISSPLNSAEIRDISQVHSVSPELLRDWSALRAMLNHYGWLARRVGDYSVPDHAVIFSILRTDGTVAGSNALGLVGRPGMVALRGTRLSQRWGKYWQSRFVQAVSATMAEKQEDFDKLMRGIEDRAADDLDIPSITGSIAGGRS